MKASAGGGSGRGLLLRQLPCLVVILVVRISSYARRNLSKHGPCTLNALDRKFPKLTETETPESAVTGISIESLVARVQSVRRAPCRDPRLTPPLSCALLAV